MLQACGGRGAALQSNLNVVKTLCDAGANPLAESQVGRRRQACLSTAGSSAGSGPRACSLPASKRRIVSACRRSGTRAQRA